MEQRTLEITIISAKDLNKVNFITKMDVYAVVFISGDSNSKQKFKTPVDKDGGNNPTWNFTVKFTIDEAAAQQNGLSLVLKLKSERVLGDKEIGEVRVPIKELLDSPGSVNGKQFVSYQIRKPDGKPKGFISFSYQFGEKAVKVDEPVMAYPPPPNMVGTSSYSYPPLPVGGYAPPRPPQYAGYGYPPQQGYGGYPSQQPGYGHGYPPQQGYGYPPVVQPQKKKNKMGMGLGAGLLGGALGGMLLGDMVSDVGAYDAGYDAGFDDAGFDF
ncbi:hypothetical protein LIER_38479 [Lithospermum erythrorhizon]|uniref:C2 domain-containing protein n=1 Tax=Lithospermum erythrorhizon TaxID=34254 RepID=A0AAV3Q0G7_LITER